MKVFVLLVALLNIVSCASDNDSMNSVKIYPYAVPEVTYESIGINPQTRIYGGREAKDGQFPYMIFALMRYKNSQFKRCSASLLNPDCVLLAAHCVVEPDSKPTDIILVGGKADLLEYIKKRIEVDFNIAIDEEAFGLQERRAKVVHSHPQFNQRSLDHDVAIIFLDEPFSLDTIKTIPLSEVKLKVPKLCTVLGWGLTKANLLNYKLNYVDDKEVHTTEMGCLAKPYGPFLCLKPDQRGICQGDSGSPLVCDDMVWGVASHLVSRTNNPACGESLEEYYSELYVDLDWIKRVSRENPSCGMKSKSLLVCVVASLWVSLTF